MMAKHLALALLGTTLVAAPALSQTNPPADSTAPASGRMNTSNWMTQEQPGQWRASKLKGLNVYNQNNEEIGDINELLVDDSGKVQAVVVGVGGFLGLGEHDVAIPFDQISLVNEPRATATTTATDGRTVGTANPNAPATAPANPNMATNNANPSAPATTGTVATDRTTANRSAPDHAMLKMNMTKDQLKAAPEFKYAR